MSEFPPGAAGGRTASSPGGRAASGSRVIDASPALALREGTDDGAPLPWDDAVAGGTIGAGGCSACWGAADRGEGAPPGSSFKKINEITSVPHDHGSWLIVPEFYRLHYECFCGGPVDPLLRKTLKPLTGDGDHLVYDFGRWQARFGQAGGDYPRHTIMEAYLPLTHAGTNPDLLEVEISETTT